MEFCSNSLFTEEEFTRSLFHTPNAYLQLPPFSSNLSYVASCWRRWMNQSKDDLPKSSDLHELAQVLLDKKRHNLTPEEVQLILKERAKVCAKIIVVVGLEITPTDLLTGFDLFLCFLVLSTARRTS